jgi:60 kDa SS-A/Ro ribonucleoprotein
MNTDLFTTTTRSTDTTNEAGGEAYAFSPKHLIAQYITTGTFSENFYSNPGEQLTGLLETLGKVDDDFVAKAAVYARTRAHMKDTPAVLCAHLATKDTDLLKKVFPRVIDNGKMLRNFAQVVRSGVTGRKSFGSAPKNLMRNFLISRTPEQLIRDSVGNRPSLGDVINMVRPKATDPAQNATFAYLIGKEFDMEHLPMRVRDYVRWRNDEAVSFEGVAWAPFELLTSKELGADEWAYIIRNAGWHMTRMNLNTALRHNVFSEHPDLIEVVADRLSNREIIKKARVFPYQIFSAYMNASDELPQPVRQGLESAISCAMENLPEVSGNVAILPDVSGSMGCPVTGYRAGATTAIRCVDVAALIASAFKYRAGNRCTVVPFDTSVHTVDFQSESVFENAKLLASYGGGGTDCSLALQHLNKADHMGDLVIYVSDNESWVRPEGEERGYWYNSSGTSVMQEWNTYKARNPSAKLVCIDIQPYGSTQAHDREDILNVGGFSDAVFDTITSFVTSGKTATDSVETFVEEIESINL